MAILERHLIVSLQVAPMVNRSSVVAKESRQFKSLSIEKFTFEAHVVAIPERPETIHIRSLCAGRERNYDPFSGLITYFEGPALDVHLFHPSIERLHPGNWTVGAATILIPILDAFLNTDQIRRKIAARVLLQLHGDHISALQLRD